MAGEHIVVGQDFQVTCSVLPLADLQNYTSPRIYYRKPNGTSSFVTPSSATGSSAVGAITSTVNALAAESAGTWKFYVYVASGSIIYRSKIAELVVHPLGFP